MKNRAHKQNKPQSANAACACFLYLTGSSNGFEMKKYDFCPNCSIGLNSREMALGFCQNCKHNWDEEDEYEDDFDHCADCDLPDACSDFGCAIKKGVREAPSW